MFQSRESRKEGTKKEKHKPTKQERKELPKRSETARAATLFIFPVGCVALCRHMEGDDAWLQNFVEQEYENKWSPVIPLREVSSSAFPSRDIPFVLELCSYTSACKKGSSCSK